MMQAYSLSAVTSSGRSWKIKMGLFSVMRRILAFRKTEGDTFCVYSLKSPLAELKALCGVVHLAPKDEHERSKGYPNVTATAPNQTRQ